MLNEKFISYEFQMYASHEPTVIVFHVDGTSSVWVQSLA